MAVTRSQRTHAEPRRSLETNRRQSTESLTISQMSLKGMERDHDENNVPGEVHSSQRTLGIGRDPDGNLTRTNRSLKRKNAYSNDYVALCGESENSLMRPLNSTYPRQLGLKTTQSLLHSQRGVLHNDDDDGPHLTGLLGTVPREALEQILGYLDPKDLANLGATCKFFIDSGITEQVARHHMKNVARAKLLQPRMDKGETYVSLLQFVQGQSAAAAQSTAVAMGTYHSVCLLSSTNEDSGMYGMYSFGRGFHGQLGTGCDEPTFSPTLIKHVEKQSLVELYQGSKSNVRLAVVHAGSSHSAAISRRGELFMWGLASSGEVGQGSWSPTEVLVPRMISNLGKMRVVSICAGANHTLAISECGQLLSCGRGRHGQLGHGHFHDEAQLRIVEAVQTQRIVSVAAGKFHSMALAADGRLFTWGAASCGQLGHETSDDESVPKYVSYLNPGNLIPSDRVTAVAAGGYHSLALTVSGDILATGRNKEGQLGIPSMSLDQVKRFSLVPIQDLYHGSVCSRAIQVQCGYLHSLALIQVNGTREVRATGCNTYGQLGTGSQHWERQFTKILFKKGSPSITSICSGDWHSGAIADDGTLYTWGRGDCGQLGHADDKSRWIPTEMENVTVVHPNMTLRRSKGAPKEAIILRSPAPEIKRRQRRRRRRICHQTAAV